MVRSTKGDHNKNGDDGEGGRAKRRERGGRERDDNDDDDDNDEAEEDNGGDEDGVRVEPEREREEFNKDKKKFWLRERQASAPSSLMTQSSTPSFELYYPSLREFYLYLNWNRSNQTECNHIISY